MEKEEVKYCYVSKGSDKREEPWKLKLKALMKYKKEDFKNDKEYKEYIKKVFSDIDSEKIIW